MTRPPRNLRQDLEEQLTFLEVSCAGFDNGLEIEAKRLAVTLRALVHDTGESRSLLERMAGKRQIKWLSGGKVNPNNRISSHVLTMWQMDNDGTKFVPLDRQDLLESGRLVEFDEWWNEKVIKDAEGVEFSRRALVLDLANRDGGAHVGEQNAGDYRLSREGSLGFREVPGGIMMRIPDVGPDTPWTLPPFTQSPIPASVRTIAEEVMISIATQAQKLFPPIE